MASALAPGAAVSVTTGAAEVVAVVRLRVHPLGSWLPALTAQERAVAAVEPKGTSP
ncbi:hypothetical protein [uncultured Jatrophihabitans sp.]|uniref:hypothetical protein n=1 Tax=uncultured Jatrophihabitans sp. TaxID=1610747 RepID=UPI0035CB2BD5